MTLRSKLALGGAAILAVSAFAWTLAVVESNEPENVSPVSAIESDFPAGFVLEPCPTEDSSDCYWDGGANGEGRAFIDLGGVPYYLPEAR